MHYTTSHALEVLRDYDDTIYLVFDAINVVDNDRSCDNDTVDMFEAALISLLLDKISSHIPDGEEAQRDILLQAEGLEELMAAWPESGSLLSQTILGYAVALSQSRWGWRPWERVRQALTQDLTEVGTDDPQETHP